MITEVSTTFSKKEEAMALAQQLLELDLIACAHTKVITSQYIWQGKYYEEDEFLISFKTTLAKKNQVVKHISANHPYDTPLISTNDIEINNTYKIWMDKVIG